MRRRARGVKLSSIIFCVTVLVAGLPAGGRAQVNSGSNGSDGAFNPTTSTNINMASRPSGIYQYTSVNIPSVVTVTFTANANNTPVVWLVQSNVVINGTDSGELQGVFQQGFLPSKHAETASLVIFSREAVRRAGSRGPVTLFPPSPESSREALFEVEPPFAAL